jgi:hypothetical protein
MIVCTGKNIHKSIPLGERKVENYSRKGDWVSKGVTRAHEHHPTTTITTCAANGPLHTTSTAHL